LIGTLCFHAQQAAEKAIKAVLVGRGVSFPRTHVIERLLDLLPAEVEITAELRESARLTAYATVSRYPGSPDPITADDHARAVWLANLVVRWAEERLAPPGSTIEDELA
jgi:HEPN domain-containing protein